MFRHSILIWLSVVVGSALLVFFGTTAFSRPAPQSQSSTGVTPQLQPVVSGLSTPVLVTNAEDGSNRLFIVELGGIIKVLQPGSTTPTQFLNITTKVLSGGEQGLLGLAFHPQYETNRRFFVNYTRQTQVCDGSGLGVTNLSWQSTGTTTVQVRVGSASGSLFAHTGPSGGGTTGKWVGEGTQFFLQDVSGGLPLTSANTLATTSVGLTSNGCSP